MSKKKKNAILIATYKLQTKDVQVRTKFPFQMIGPSSSKQITSQDQVPRNKA